MYARQIRHPKAFFFCETRQEATLGENAFHISSSVQYSDTSISEYN